MLTKFGKILRIIRLKRNEKLKDMAGKLKITPSYLSSVENGKKPITKEFVDRLFSFYNFNDEEKDKIKEAYVKTSHSITIPFDDKEEELCILFYKNFYNLSKNKKKEILNILRKS